VVLDPQEIRVILDQQDRPEKAILVSQDTLDRRDQVILDIRVLQVIAVMTELQALRAILGRWDRVILELQERRVILDTLDLLDRQDRALQVLQAIPVRQAKVVQVTRDILDQRDQEVLDLQETGATLDTLALPDQQDQALQALQVILDRRVKDLQATLATLAQRDQMA
jgi:hypothetical protein